MPLRQSRLKFGQQLPETTITRETVTSKISSTLLTISEPVDAKDIDADTIVVDISGSHAQLPTPSESATDVSSQGSVSEPTKFKAQINSGRVISARKSRFREEALDLMQPTASDQQRSISGETLVHNRSGLDSLQKGIKAFDMEWDLSFSNHALGSDDQEGLDLDKNTSQDDAEAQSTLIVRVEDEEDEAERQAKAEARRLKMEENAKKWESRKKAAEKNATRRSNRSSLAIEKTGDLLNNLASTVLGKRSRDSVLKAEPAGRKAVSGNSQTNGIDDKELNTKRARVGETEMTSADATRPLPSKRQKRWLVSGLYAGQGRTFDARLNESSNNKKKDSTPPMEVARKENAILPLPMFAGERLLKQGRDFKLPFDVHSPVPPGQAKPEGWRKQNRNYYVGDALNLWRADAYKESSFCYCTPETGCDHDCLNRTMYYECDALNCNLTPATCGNRQWEDLHERAKLNCSYSIGVDIIKTASRGHGVRANRTFEPNQIILEYCGEILTQEECERRMREEYKDKDCYYLMLYDQNMILDATRGSMARFVNHSCEPNCRMEKWTVHGTPRMALYAGERGIMTGEELTYDYNFDPYSQKNVQKCLCGSKNCRGFLGPRPKDIKQKSPETDKPRGASEGKLSGAKRKFAEALEEGTNRLNKKVKSNSKTLGKGTSKGKQNKSASPKKIVVVKQISKTKVSVLKKTTKSKIKTDRTLKKIISDAKKKAVSGKGKRVISSTSMEEALIRKQPGSKTKKPLGRTSSLKEKAASLKRNVVNTVRRGKK